MATRSRKKRSCRVEIVHKDLHDLAPYENNPRINTAAVDSVANSIEQFGFLVPIVLDSNDTIVAGHTRYVAAQNLGLTEVPCVVVEDLSEEQINAFRLIDNKVSELAVWDQELLSTEITALQNSGIDLTGFGWTPLEIDCFSDVVSDDCMGAGAAIGDAPQSASQNSRAPNTSRVVIGEIVFFLPQTAYRRWVTALRAEHDFDEAAITEDIQDRLGMTPYIVAERRDRP